MTPTPITREDMCVNPADWHGEERRVYTPVDLRHLGWGPRFAMFGLIFTLIINIVVTSMSYQRLVSQTNINTERIQEIRTVDIELMRMVNDLTRSVATLHANVSDLSMDIRDHRTDTTAH